MINIRVLAGQLPKVKVALNAPGVAVEKAGIFVQLLAAPDRL